MMSLLGALAALASGVVKEGVGFHWLANFGTLTAIFILVAVLRVARARYACHLITEFAPSISCFSSLPAVLLADVGNTRWLSPPK